MKLNVVVDIQVSSPMADFSSTLELGDFQDRVLVVVVHSQTFLVGLDELEICGFRDMCERSVGNRCSRLCRNTVSGELVNTLGSRE